MVGCKIAGGNYRGECRNPTLVFGKLVLVRRELPNKINPATQPVSLAAPFSETIKGKLVPKPTPSLRV